MQDIATKAGVGKTTVSLALRNDPRLRTETRERIQAIARELGYRPHPLYSTLLSQVRARKPVSQRENLAFLTAFPTRDGWRKSSFVYNEYREGAAERARQLGYALEDFWTKEPGMTGRRLTQILETRNIRGLLIAPLPSARGHLSLEWSKFAAATLGPSLYKPDLSRATADHFGGFTMALRKLAKLGYRRIGLMTQRSGEARVNYAYTAALYHYQHTIPAANRIPPLIRDGLTEPQYRQWFNRHRPDVVMGGPGLMNWAMAWGLRVPHDLGYADPQRPPWTPWAGIDYHYRVIGAAGVDLVVGQLQRNESGVPAHPKVVTIRGTWAEGNTVRKQ